MYLGRRVSLAALLVISVTACGGTANAAPDKTIACYDNGQKLPDDAVNAFKNSPGDILSKSPGELVALVRDLAATDSSLLSKIMEQAVHASPEQKHSIGSGLGQAARICVGKGKDGQEYASEIQQAIADSRDPALQLAYASTAGDQPIGAGPGAGGSPGASGGGTGVATGTGGGTGGAEGIGGNGVNTGQFTMTGSVSGTGSVSPQ